VRKLVIVRRNLRPHRASKNVKAAAFRAHGCPPAQHGCRPFDCPLVPSRHRGPPFTACLKLSSPGRSTQSGDPEDGTLFQLGSSPALSLFPRHRTMSCAADHDWQRQADGIGHRTADPRPTGQP